MNQQTKLTNQPESLEEYVRKRNQFAKKEDIPEGNFPAEFLAMLPAKKWRCTDPHSYFHFFMKVNGIEYCPGFLSIQYPDKTGLLFHLICILHKMPPSGGVINDLSMYKGYKLTISVKAYYAEKGRYWYPRVTGVYVLGRINSVNKGGVADGRK